MANRIDQLYREASNLPPSERIALTGLLVDALEGSTEADVEKEWRREVAKRMNELDQGVARTIPWRQVRAKLRRIVDAK